MSTTTSSDGASSTLSATTSTIADGAANPSSSSSTTIGGSTTTTQTGQDIATSTSITFTSSSPTSIITSTRPNSTSAVNGTTSPSATSTNSPTASQGLSPGATAGVAIATFIVGALLAFGIAVIFFKKRKRSHEGGYIGTAANEKKSDTDLEYVFPQPKDDSSMRKSVTALYTQIDNHAENFYHGEKVAGEGNLFNRKTRFFAIKKLICEEMLHAIDWDTQPDRSLLPSNVTAVTRNMVRDFDNPANETVWSSWRVSSSYLLGHENAGGNDREQRVSAVLVDRLEQQLQPFHNRASNTQRQEDLVAICNLAASLGLLIFAQPARWELKWPSTARGDGSRAGFVYFPAFVRSTDNKARKLDRPEVVIEAAQVQ